MFIHISEEPNIKEFVPRDSEIWPELGPVVWGLAEDKRINYLFPRECPRIIYSYSPEVTATDANLFFPNTRSKTIITVENRWYERIKRATLYQYVFNAQGFELLDEIAGYYVSRDVVKPESVEVIEDVIDKILMHEVDLRFTPDLHPLRDALVASSINRFSIIRFKNAIQH